MPEDLRRELLAVLRRSEIVGRYASNIENDLRARGEHDLADVFLDGLHYVPYPLRYR